MRSKLAIIAYLPSGTTFVVLGLSYMKVQKSNELSRKTDQLDLEIKNDLQALNDSLLEVIPAERMDSLLSMLAVRDQELNELRNAGWEEAFLEISLEQNKGTAFFLYAPGIFRDRTQAGKFALFFSRSLYGSDEAHLKINQFAELNIHRQLRRQVPGKYNYVYLATPTHNDSIQFLLKYLPDNWGLTDKIPNLFTDTQYTSRDTAYARLFLQSFGKIVSPKEQREKALVRNIMIDDVRGLHY